MREEPISVVLVEDQETVRLGLAALLDGTPGYRCAGAFRSGEELLAGLVRVRPRVALVDIGLPGISGIEAIRRARTVAPELAALILTVYEDDDRVLEALCAGACGYLVKKTPPARLLEAIADAAAGGSPMSSGIARRVVELLRHFGNGTRRSAGHEPLTAREREVLRGLAQGGTYQTVGRSLHIATDTVRFHIRNVYKKLAAHSQSEAVAKALRRGLL